MNRSNFGYKLTEIASERNFILFLNHNTQTSTVVLLQNFNSGQLFHSKNFIFCSYKIQNIKYLLILLAFDITSI